MDLSRADRIIELQSAIDRCRRHLESASNDEARETYLQLIRNYEQIISDLTGVGMATNERPKVISQYLRMVNKSFLTIMAVVEVALNDPEVLKSGEIYKRIGLNARHMEPTFQQLVHDQIFSSARGAKGGLTLGRPGHEITLAEICQSVSRANPAEHIIAVEMRLSEMATKVIRPLFSDLEARIISQLALVTVGDLVAQARRLQEAPALSVVDPEPKAGEGGVIRLD